MSSIRLLTWFGQGVAGSLRPNPRRTADLKEIMWSHGDKWQLFLVQCVIHNVHDMYTYSWYGFCCRCQVLEIFCLRCLDLEVFSISYFKHEMHSFGSSEAFLISFFLKSVDFKVLFQQFMFQWGNKTLNTCWKLGEFTSTPCLVRHWLWHPCPWCWQALTTVRDDSWERCLDQWSSPNLLEDLGESGAQMNTGLKHFHGFCHPEH